MALLELQRSADVVDRAQARRAGGQHNRPHAAPPDLRGDGIEVDAPVRVGGHGTRLDTEHLAHAPVRVVGGFGVHDRRGGRELARDPQRFEVGDRPARRQMAKRLLRQPEHDSERPHHLDLHR